ncbi:MAG: RNA-splicing ligase RtcB [Woeseiaceae bacterium]|nr:RNA-splicing ligase RtcB [Woeseiaceae bacterium]NIP20145.1 RNA-splicing ligase RtcB [Woeseiaceae bacterium]NIS88941.1 RNA-splicing ligase RtcB [Woeseiaceae bacterium]
MDLSRLRQDSEYRWRLPAEGPMHVPGILYGDREQILQMDDKVYTQLRNVTLLPGLAGPVYAMPDAHWGYGFPIGGVAAFDADAGGVVSAGGVGFDISCGVRALHTRLGPADIESVKSELADALFEEIPVGVGSQGRISLDQDAMDAMLRGGARWAVDQGYGTDADLERTEERGCIKGAQPGHVSDHAKRRQRREMGTLGSGNHYLEVQRVATVFDQGIADEFALAENDIIISIHCGSRGLGHQIGTDYLREMLIAAPDFGLELPDRELACAPIRSDLGQRYLGAMRSGMNCALANRQILTHLTRDVFARVLPAARLELLYDVSHNICKVETHVIDGKARELYVHRKGATRAFGPGNADLEEEIRDAGQPVLIGGSMGTGSYVLAGTREGEELSLSSACHGAGRAMSRRQARRQFSGRQVVDELAVRGIVIRSPSQRGVAEEAPLAYKDVDRVVDIADKAGLARKVARLEPVICIKG